MGSLFLKPDFVWEEWRFDDKEYPSLTGGLAVSRERKKSANFQQNRNNGNRKTYNIQNMIHDKGIET